MRCIGIERAILLAIALIGGASCGEQASHTRFNGSAGPLDESTGLPTRFRDERSEIEFVLVKPGRFIRGASGRDAGSSEEELPAHEVRITKPFYLSVCEVTREQWDRIMNPAGVAREQRSDHANPKLLRHAEPISGVELDQIKKFLDETGCRLPTEAEWEYAARAGSEDPRYGAIDDIAWFEGNSAGRIHPVKLKRPNAWGLFDMLGNAAEWCADRYARATYENCRPGIADPVHFPTGLERLSGDGFNVVRGGSWATLGDCCRASGRAWREPSDPPFDVGLRVARDP